MLREFKTTLGTVDVAKDVLREECCLMACPPWLTMSVCF